MISQCANPACNKPFHYRRGGRLYRFEMIGQGAGAEAVSNAICSLKHGGAAVFFWLCKRCSSMLSLTFDGQHPSVRPIPPLGCGKAPVLAVGEVTTGSQAVPNGASAPRANPGKPDDSQLIRR
jgi:hypothetical protein